MRLALLILLAATAMTPASASTTPAPAALKLPPGAALSPLAQQDDTASPSPRAQPQPTPAIQTVAMASASDQGGPGTDAQDSERDSWNALAPVAITLALIGAIALRRHKAGKS